MLDYIITTPLYNINGSLPYIDIKLIYMKYFNLLPIGINFINYDEVVKIKENNIILILCPDNRISVLLKIKDQFISFNLSFKHLNIYRDKINQITTHNYYLFQKTTKFRSMQLL